MEKSGRITFLICFILISPLLSNIFDQKQLDENFVYGVETNSQSGIIDVQTWQINDNWMYSGYLDVGDFITSSGISTTVNYLNGTLDKTVTSIFLSIIDNQSSLTYKVESIGEYAANDVELDGQNGDISVNINTIEIIRASDMATVSQEASIEIDFCADLFWWCVNIDVADLILNNSYYPALEGLDFPLNVGESWDSDYHQETTYSGSSNYVDIPDNSEDDNTSSWQTVSQGFSGVSYAGCGQSYNITTYNGDGEESGYRWYCPAINGDIISSFTQSLGFKAVHELVAYQPVTRFKEINIDLEYPLSPIDTDIYAWINVTNQGTPVSDLELEFRYEIEDDVRSFTTDQNGSYYLEFNTGNSTDTTASVDDLASHGIIVWANQSSPILGAVSVSTNLNIHEIDLVTRAEGVTVQRTRNNSTLTLDTNIGFTAVYGDILVFSVPVANKGLISSPSSNLKIDSPDGNTLFAIVPPLSSLQESRIEVNWTVPFQQSYGSVYLEFLVDPDETLIQDGNKSNNYGIFTLFIGTIPIAALEHPTEILTLDEITLNGTTSYDSDGGSYFCDFYIEISINIFENFFEEDCIYEAKWDDDGQFQILLTITDEENDQDTFMSSISIVNRPPQITLISDKTSVTVFSEVTFEIIERIDLDTQSPNSPVDILWDNPNCKEGQISTKCTLTPLNEGEFSINVSAIDDDGAITFASSSVMATNIAPFDPKIEVWSGPNKITPDNRGVFAAKEGEILTLKAWVTDSENDMNSLQYIWSPDAENNPELELTSYGIMGEINHTYGFAGLQLATLQIFDNDNESTVFEGETKTLIIPIEIENIAPYVVSISPRLPVQEGEELIFDIGVIDTPNDVDSLTSCFDIDPSVNSDLLGNEDDDCDFTSTYLSYIWEDSVSAPEFIIFHVMDDDGSRDFVNIDIDIRNTRPTAVASTNNLNPQQGQAISLSANGTIDSEFDIENMIYHWDIDTSLDSDGDGNPSNDIDMIGRWIQVFYDDEGKKVVKLTVYDESESNSITMVVDVSKAPLNFENRIKENSSTILLLILISTGGVFLSIRYRNKEDDKTTNNKLKDSNLDQLFDSIGSNKSINYADMASDTSELKNNHAIESSTLEKQILTPNAILSEDDIEALFEE